jgi:hypothetical protein
LDFRAENKSLSEGNPDLSRESVMSADNEAQELKSPNSGSNSPHNSEHAHDEFTYAENDVPGKTILTYLNIVHTKTTVIRKIWNH